MSIIFRHRTIRVNADAEASINALKKTACTAALNHLANNFSKDSFRYNMRIALAVDGLLASIHISGTVESKDGFCIIRYRMRPVFIFFISPAFAMIFSLYDFISSFPSGEIWSYFAVNAIVWLFLFLEVPWREKDCEERILRKLSEVDKYHDVSFS